MNITFRGKTRQATFVLYPGNRVGILFGNPDVELSVDLAYIKYTVGHRLATLEEVYINSSDEFEGAVEALIEAGIVERSGLIDQSGYVDAELCRFTDKAMEEIRAKFKGPAPTPSDGINDFLSVLKKFDGVRESDDIQKFIDILNKVNEIPVSELTQFYDPNDKERGVNRRPVVEEAISRHQLDSPFLRHKLVIEATEMAPRYLISKSGDCNWANLKIVKENGFSVFIGTKDLPGFIRTKQGLIVY
ncbi:MAG TPA: hypothetical protein VN843_00595 [Anaerolineales bacterium]|nr:hypothetical protein [Anaerolineales bacterium]